MKKRIKRKLFILPVVALSFLIIVPTVYAHNVRSFLENAQRYYDSNCQNSRNQSPTMTINCYLFEKVKSLDDSINNLGSRLRRTERVNSSQSDLISELQEKVLALETTLTPIPTVTPTSTPQITSTPTLTPTPTDLPTATPTPTVTPTSTPGFTVTPTLTPTSTPEPTPTATSGAGANSVVINEIMWMGSILDVTPTPTPSSADEWIELKNTTAQDIDITGWKIVGAGTGSTAVTLAGTIPAGGYFLLSNFASTSSAIKDSITVNQIASLSLVNTGEQLVLKDLSDGVVDQTPLTSGSWAAGFSGATKNSMERISPPGDGTVSSNWNMCDDPACNDAIYWDTEGSNYGTPKSPNL